MQRPNLSDLGCLHSGHCGRAGSSLCHPGSAGSLWSSPTLAACGPWSPTSQTIVRGSSFPAYTLASEEAQASYFLGVTSVDPMKPAKPRAHGTRSWSSPGPCPHREAHVSAKRLQSEALAETVENIEHVVAVLIKESSCTMSKHVPVPRTCSAPSTCKAREGKRDRHGFRRWGGGNGLQQKALLGGHRSSLSSLPEHLSR